MTARPPMPRTETQPETSKSKTRFTKGPWRTDPECGNESVLGPDGRMVADCAIFSFPEPKNAVERNHANAHLIAAAPDLYAALVELVAAHDDYEPGSISDKRLRAAEQAADLALARARGEAVS